MFDLPRTTLQTFFWSTILFSCVDTMAYFYYSLFYKWNRVLRWMKTHTRFFSEEGRNLERKKEEIVKVGGIYIFNE